MLAYAAIVGALGVSAAWVWGGAFAHDGRDRIAAGGGAQAVAPARARLFVRAGSTSSTTLGGSSTLGGSASTGAHADFATADTDQDGRLSIAELQVVMPDVTINDEDGDGYVSQGEAEAGISGLAFSSGDATGDIGEEEYDEIVAMMDDDSSLDSGADLDTGADAGAAEQPDLESGSDN